jgi:hypothetical protein
MTVPNIEKYVCPVSGEKYMTDSMKWNFRATLYLILTVVRMSCIGLGSK